MIRLLQNIFIYLGCCVVIVAFLGGLWLYEYAVWTECLKDHPWWYCWRIIT